jgi:hypothetical protein
MMILTPLSELDYEFGERPLLFPNNTFWCIRYWEDKASDEEIQKAMRSLGKGVNLSDQILEICPADPSTVFGVWSPRLTATGMPNQDPEKKSLKLAPLGKGI